MKIIGVDASTKRIAIVQFKDGNLDDWNLISTMEHPLDDRIFDLYHKFKEQIECRFKPDLVIFEEIPFVRNFRAERALSEIVGCCKLVCQENNINYRVVNNTVWKKQVLGDGRATKDEIKAFVIVKYPILTFEKQDILDACAICLMGVNRVKEGVESNGI